jgi:hypothetical protein
VILAALLVVSCSRAVEIPRADIDDPQYREPGSYRIRLKGREEYIAKRFSVTDSTVVIEQLHPADERYRQWEDARPITIPIADVSSFARYKTHALGTTAWVVLVGGFILLVVAAKSIDFE